MYTLVIILLLMMSAALLLEVCRPPHWILYARFVQSRIARHQPSMGSSAAGRSYQQPGHPSSRHHRLLEGRHFRLCRALFWDRKRFAGVYAVLLYPPSTGDDNVLTPQLCVCCPDLQRLQAESDERRFPSHTDTALHRSSEPIHSAIHEEYAWICLHQICQFEKAPGTCQLILSRYLLYRFYELHQSQCSGGLL